MRSIAVRAAVIAGVAAALSLTAVLSRATAADLPLAMSTTSLPSNSVSGATGIVQINVTSGIGNQQANVVGLNVQATVTQSAPSPFSHAVAPGQAIIEAGALHDVHGLIQINETSGSGNVTSNVLTLTHGLAPTLVTADLGGLRPAASRAASVGARAPGSAATVAAGAFSGSTGVLQLNQVAGNGNRSQNDLTLTMPPTH